MPPSVIPETLTAAVRHHQAGRLAEAEAMYRDILVTHPDQPDALHLLGVIAHQRGQHDEAIEKIQRCIALRPKFAPAYYHLGDALRELRQFERAMAAYRQAIALKPDYAEAHHNLGLTFKQAGQFDEAIAAYQRAIALSPQNAVMYNSLGNALREKGRRAEAAASYERALQLNASFAAARYNLANLWREDGRLEDAIAAYRQVLQIQPNHVEASHSLGLALTQCGRLDEGIAALRNSLAHRPNSIEASRDLGLALTQRGQLDEAIAIYEHLLASCPDYAEVYNNLGIALKERGRLDDAIAAHRRALELKPGLIEAQNNLGAALKDRGDVAEAIEVFRRAVEAAPDQPLIHSNLIFALYYDPQETPATITAELGKWNRRYCRSLASSPRPHGNDRSPTRRIKIGYVSAGFRDDAVGANLIPLLRQHDHRNFEIVCYSNTLRRDSLTAEFERCADQWRNVIGVPDATLAEMIRADGIDILVDLSQHIAGNRLPVFARKPAPVQVSFLGYPDCAGLDTIDYRLSDLWLEATASPAEVQSACSAEHVFLLESFWCYAPFEADLPVNALPMASQRRVTFGCLANFCKLNEPVLRLWARILTQVPDSRLLLLCDTGSQRQRTLDFLLGEGIAPERIEFFNRRPRRSYLELYQQIDLALDPFPYNGHTTSLDALWMGVPVVSLAGDTRVARGGLSILSNLGLRNLVANSEEEYGNIAVGLAKNAARLADLRATLRSRLEVSALLDAPRFARQIEGAYRAMWQQWCQAPVP